MNKCGALGDLISFIIFIVVGFMVFNVMNEAMDSIEEGCFNDTSIDNNTSNSMSIVFCPIFEDEEGEFPLIKVMWDFFPFFLGLFMVLTAWRMLKPVFRSFTGFDWSSSDYPESNDDDEEEQHLKKLKTKLKKEFSYNSDSKPQTKKGVDWGSGVELGKGIEDYENKMKGGDK